MSTLNIFNSDGKKIRSLDGEITMEDHDRRLLGLDMPNDAYFHEEIMGHRFNFHVLDHRAAALSLGEEAYAVQIDGSRLEILREYGHTEFDEISIYSTVLPLEDGDILSDRELYQLIADAIRVELERIQCWDSELEALYRRGMRNLVDKSRSRFETLEDAKSQITRAFKTIRGSEKWLSAYIIATQHRIPSSLFDDDDSFFGYIVDKAEIRNPWADKISTLS